MDCSPIRCAPPVHQNLPVMSRDPKDSLGRHGSRVVVDILASAAFSDDGAKFFCISWPQGYARKLCGIAEQKGLEFMDREIGKKGDFVGFRF